MIYINSINRAKKILIIIVPGILGSELFLNANNKSRLWLPTDIKDGMLPISKLKHLYLDDDGKSIYDVDSIETDSINIEENNTNIGIKNIYANILCYFKNIYGQNNVKFFNYDWRLSFETSSLKLKKLIEQNYKRFDETIIIAHSFGGLIAASILQKFNFENLKLITLGTPFLGAPLTLGYFLSDSLFGPNLDKSLLDIETPLIKNLVINMPSAYELLPTQTYLLYENYLHKTKIENNVETYNYILDIKETNNFIDNNLNKKLFDIAKSNHENLDIRNTIINKDIFTIVGYSGKTPRKIICTNTDICDKADFCQDCQDCQNIKIIYDDYGDETVTLISATANFSVPEEKICFVREKHRNLINNENIYRYIIAKIDNWDNTEVSKLGYNKSFIAKKMNEEYQRVYKDIVIKIPINFKIIKIFDNYQNLILELEPFNNYFIKDRFVTKVKSLAFNIKIHFKININDTSEKYKIVLKYDQNQNYNISFDDNLIDISKEVNFEHKFISIVLE